MKFSFEIDPEIFILIPTVIITTNHPTIGICWMCFAFSVKWEKQNA